MYTPRSDQDVTIFARKRRRRKGKFLKGFHHWEDARPSVNREARRRERHQAKAALR